MFKWVMLFSPRSPYGIAPNNAPQVGMQMDTNHEGTNHILLFTVFNPMYPITVVSVCSEEGSDVCVCAFM